MQQFENIIIEAIRSKRQIRTLLKQGHIDEQEAAHRLSNAEQVILFARVARKREEKGDRASIRTYRKPGIWS
jgi:hypothetical protein